VISEYTKRYTDYLESEIRRLLYENEKLRNQFEVNNPIETFDFEDSFSRNSWTVPRQASLLYKQSPEECQTVVRLKVGDHQSDMFCSDHMVFHENVLEEFIRIFLHRVFSDRIEKVKKETKER